MPRNVVDYGTPQQPNLEAISKAVSSRLNSYNDFLSRYHLSIINKDTHLVRTLKKPNTARMISGVYCGSQKVGDLYVILFAPGDGTGKEGGYVRNKFGVLGITLIDMETNVTIQVPTQYQAENVNSTEGIVPRKKLKEGVLLEACFPLGTIEGKYAFPHAISLEQVTVDNHQSPSQLVRGLQMGFDQESYVSMLQDPVAFPMMVADENPNPIYLTCGYRCNGQRFGDPHATYFNPKLAEGHPHRMQVAGFLAVESVDNPLCKVLDEIAHVPK